MVLRQNVLQSPSCKKIRKIEPRIHPFFSAATGTMTYSFISLIRGWHQIFSGGHYNAYESNDIILKYYLSYIWPWQGFFWLAVRKRTSLDKITKSNSMWRSWTWSAVHLLLLLILLLLPLCTRPPPHPRRRKRKEDWWPGTPQGLWSTWPQAAQLWGWGRWPSSGSPWEKSPCSAPALQACAEVVPNMALQDETNLYASGSSFSSFWSMCFNTSGSTTLLSTWAVCWKISAERSFHLPRRLVNSILPRGVSSSILRVLLAVDKESRPPQVLLLHLGGKLLHVKSLDDDGQRKYWDSSAPWRRRRPGRSGGRCRSPPPATRGQTLQLQARRACAKFIWTLTASEKDDVYQPLGVEKLVHHLRVTFTNFNLSRVLKNTSGTSLQPARKVGQQKHVLKWGSTRHPLVCHPKVCLCCCPSSPHDGSRPIEAFVWQCTIRFLKLIFAFVAFVCCYFFPF